MRIGIIFCLIHFLCLSTLAQVQSIVTPSKFGLYAYQNAGALGGVGISAYPFKGYPNLGLKAGGFYYQGSIFSHFFKTDVKYTGMEFGVDLLKERYRKRSNTTKKRYHGFNISGFYTTNGQINRLDWGADCSNFAGLIVWKVDNTSFAYGARFNYRISRVYESPHLLTVFSLMPEVRFLKCTTDYDVTCDRATYQRKTIKSTLFPVSIKFQMDILLKVKRT